MSWNDVCSYVFLAFLLTTLTGGIFTAAWLAFRKCLGARCVRLMDICLKICIQTYVVPVLFLVMILQHRDNYFMRFGGNHLVTDRLIVLSPEMQRLFAVLGSIWLCAAAVTVGYWLIQGIRLKQKLSGSVPEYDPDVLLCYERVKEHLGIHRSVPLMRNDLFTIPSAAGVFRQAVVLPFENYSEKELQVIFVHELTHCKRYDLFFKIESILVNVLHAVNPLAYIVRHYVSDHAEAACDILACESAAQLFTVKEYYGTVLKLMEEDNKGASTLMSALVRRAPQLERRIKIMKVYQKKGSVKKSIALLIMSVFVVGSSMTAYAAGSEFIDMQNDFYEATREFDNQNGNTLEEHVIPADQVRHDNEVIVQDAEMVPYDTWPVNWDVPAGKKYLTTSFKLTSGDKVSVAIVLSPDNKTVRVGLEYPDGSEHYVEGTAGLAHVFTVPTTGSGYHFYVENISDTEVNARGSYVY